MGPLLLLWANPLARRAMLVTVGALVLLGAWYGFARHYISIGEVKGGVKAVETSQVAVNGLREGDRAQTAVQISAADVKAAAADAKASAAQQRADHLERDYESLKRQADEDRRRVAAVPSGGLHSYNVEHLAARAQGDTSPGYTEGEERRIAELVTAAPNIAQQLDTLSQRVGQLEQRADALVDKVAARDEKYAALAGYTTRLEGYFVTVYNDTPKKRRGWKCLKVWQCGESKLSVPDPAGLIASRPK